MFCKSRAPGAFDERIVSADVVVAGGGDEVKSFSLPLGSAEYQSIFSDSRATPEQQAQPKSYMQIKDRGLWAPPEQLQEAAKRTAAMGAWQRYLDPEKKTVFWVNHHTKEITFHAPSRFSPPKSPASRARTNSPSVSSVHGSHGANSPKLPLQENTNQQISNQQNQMPLAKQQLLVPADSPMPQQQQPVPEPDVREEITIPLQEVQMQAPPRMNRPQQQQEQQQQQQQQQQPGVPQLQQGAGEWDVTASSPAVSQFTLTHKRPTVGGPAGGGGADAAPTLLPQLGAGPPSKAPCYRLPNLQRGGTAPGALDRSAEDMLGPLQVHTQNTDPNLATGTPTERRAHEEARVAGTPPFSLVPEVTATPERAHERPRKKKAETPGSVERLFGRRDLGDEEEAEIGLC